MPRPRPATGGTGGRPSTLPCVPGVLNADQLRASAAAIAAVQQPDGGIPWFAGGHLDPWNHVEAAMALDVAGRHDRAAAAYAWLRRAQLDDGSWYAAYRCGRPHRRARETNFCAYPAVGVWHHLCATGDQAFLEAMWPTVRAALDFVVAQQSPGGQIRWALDPAGRPACGALLSGSASTYLSLRCGLAVAARVGAPQPDWELAAGLLGHAVACHPDRFLPKARFSMDWYYPVLSGALGGQQARERIARRWPTFVVDGLGVRCVADRPWVTGAETCELALALDTVGDRQTAVRLLAWAQRLRGADGAYWTGYVYPDDAYWPVERTTWTTAAVLLAADALADVTPTAGLFRGRDLPLGIDPADVACDPAPLPGHSRS